MPAPPESPAPGTGLPLAALRILFWALLATALFFALNPLPPRVPLDRLGDKWEHMIAFAALTGVALLAWPRVPAWRIAAALAAVGGLIEVVQAVPVLHRDSDWRDLSSDCAAIAMTVVVVRPLAKRFARRAALP